MNAPILMLVFAGLALAGIGVIGGDTTAASVVEAPKESPPSFNVERRTYKGIYPAPPESLPRGVRRIPGF